MTMPTPARYLAALAAMLTAPLTTNADEPVTLDVTPSICLLAPGATTCRTDVALRWQSATARFACLLRLEPGDALRCWESALSGEYRDVHDAATASIYTLTNRDNEPLASASVDVLEVQPTDRRRSRRNRHVWDIL